MKQLLFILCVFGIVSCGTADQFDKNSAVLIEPEKFSEILKDYALMESTLNLNVLGSETYSFDSIYNFDILNEHQVTKTQFDTTMKYYSAHPKEFKELMDGVLEKLNSKIIK